MTGQSLQVLGHDFAFAHGRSGALQLLLLTRSDVDRLLGAHDIQELRRILGELKFTSHLDQSLSEPQDLLTACGRWLRSEVDRMCPEEELSTFDILWIEEDLPFIAALLKRRHGLHAGVTESPLPILSAFTPELLQRFVLEGDAEGAPKELVTFIEQMSALETPDARAIDSAVAQWAANLRLEHARRSSSNLIRTYVQHLIDTQNIRTAFRLRSEDRGNAAAFFLHGGTLAPETLLGSSEDIVHVIERSDLSYHASAAIAKATKDPLSLERALSELLAADIAAMWNIPLSIEPLFAFAAIGLTQLRLLRAIVIGKRNRLSPQDIKRVLPPFLSASHYLG
jgi:hypothetical protein